MPYIRILVVDDYKEWRNLIRLLLLVRPGWQVIAETTDGPDAVLKAKELKPDLILMDIGLPTLNGIEAARQIRQSSPNSKIIFLSQENSSDVVQAALSTGAQGYVHKLRAHSELRPAIETVFRGNQFVGGLENHQLGESTRAEPQLRHAVQFYSDDAVFLESFTHFVATALETGKAAIVLVSESHRHGLFQRLKARGLDVAAAIESGRLLPLDHAWALSTFMVNDMPDPVRLFEIVGGLIQRATKTTTRDQKPRVAACGECAPLLWAEGKVDAAIRLEQLWNQLVKTYEFDTLCGYPLASFQKDGPSFQNICAEHSAVYSR